MNSDDLGAPVAQLQRVRDAAAASTSPAESAHADLLRLRAGTAKALAAEIENRLSKILARGTSSYPRSNPS